jgi:endo-1,4-beta-xylanase
MDVRPIKYSGSFTVNSGLGSLGVYGWTTNPLVEYYVMETNHGISTGGTNMGTFTSDGATYTIWKHQQFKARRHSGNTFQSATARALRVLSQCKTTSAPGRPKA